MPVWSVAQSETTKNPSDKINKNINGFIGVFATCSHLMLCHGTNYKWADHTRQSSHTVGDAHEDTGIARGDVQVVDIETLC